MEHKITIKAKNDYRSFKKDYTVTLDYNEVDAIYLMGKNGCGKSTLVQAIRGKNNSNNDAQRKWNAKGVCSNVLDKFDVEIDDFDKIYHLDIDGLDNTTSMWNAADATGYIEFGGWQTKQLSAGEKSIMMFSKLREQVEDKENTLIILDELDGHFDTEFTLRFPKLLNKLFPKSKKLIVTHDILMATINDGNIVDILSNRDKKNYSKCLVIENEPIVYDNETKEIKFIAETLHSLSKIEDKKQEIK